MDRLIAYDGEIMRFLPTSSPLSSQLNSFPPSLSALCENIETTKDAGLTPIILCDIDGSVYNARKKASRVIRTWAHEFKGVGREQLLAHIKSTDERKRNSLASAWNSSSYLQALGLASRFPDMVIAADHFFQSHFFNWENWTADEAIPEMIAKLEAVRAFGAQMLFVSLRGKSDDQTLEGSSTENMLKSIGAWKAGDELVIKEGKSEHLDEKELEAGIHREPYKADLVIPHLLHRTNIRNPMVVAMLDNDPRQLNYAQLTLGAFIAYFLVEGDLPPGSPEPNKGITRLNY